MKQPSEPLGVKIVGGLKETFTCSLTICSSCWKKAALPEEHADAHPKRLRFAVFMMMVRLVNYAGQSIGSIAAIAWGVLIAPARRMIALLGLSPGRQP